MAFRIGPVLSEQRPLDAICCQGACDACRAFSAGPIVARPAALPPFSGVLRSKRHENGALQNSPCSSLYELVPNERVALQRFGDVQLPIISGVFLLLPFLVDHSLRQAVVRP